jgi:hypothetical protein
MRSIISLPIRVAITSLYIVGSMPIEAYVAKNKLYGRSSMALNPPLKYIMYRHLAMKKTTSNSWVIRSQKLLRRFNLKSLTAIFKEPPTKNEWKKTVDELLADEDRSR